MESNILQKHLEEGRSWEQEIWRKRRRLLNLSWALTGFFGLVALLALLCLWALIPLKTFEPYMVTVDRASGFLEIKRSLNEDKKIEQYEAVVMASIVRYIRARETWDEPFAVENYNMSMLYSAGPAAAELARIYAADNPDRPDKVFGRELRIAVSVDSVLFLNNKTATVQFRTVQTDLQSGTSAKPQFWVGMVEFRVTGAPLENKYRFDNPIGFQVTQYHKEQSAIPFVPAATEGDGMNAL